jgi:small subunit ribosomal protein S6e
MRINIAYPRNGTQKSLKFDDEKQWSRLIDRRLGQEFDGELFGPEYKGYIFRITGGSDRDGFAMKQGVMTKAKLQLLLKEGSTGYFARREGTSLRKTVRGCIVGGELGAINLIVVQKGEKEIAGLTDVTIPRRLGPKRANKIRKLFNIPKHSDNIGVKDAKKIKVDPLDVCRVVIKRITKKVGDKSYYKAPKIQRLITSERLRRKRVRQAEKYDTVKKNQAKFEAFKKHEAAKHQPVQKATPAPVKAAPVKVAPVKTAPVKAAPVKAAPAKPVQPVKVQKPTDKKTK